MDGPIVYCLSAPEDKAYLHAFQQHSKPLRRSGKLRLVDRETALAGFPVAGDPLVAEAQVVLALLTPGLLDDDRNWGLLTGALARRQRVLPVRVLPCDINAAGLGDLQALPRVDDVGRPEPWINDPKNHAGWQAVCEELAVVLALLRPATPKGALALLPPPPRCFGRDHELTLLTEQFLRSEPVLVLGSPGQGKTTLVLTALHSLPVAARYRDRRFFIRCDGLTGRNALLVETARVLGITPSPHMEDELLKNLAQERVLLVLDNAETPLDVEREAVEKFCDLLAFFATVVLTVRGDQTPGHLAFQKPVVVGRLDLEPARLLFLTITRQRHAQDPRLDVLLNAVDRVPLALTLLAHLAESDPTLEVVWAQWHSEGPAALRRGPDRRNDLTHSLDLSIKSPRMLACPEALRLLALLGLLPDGILWKDLDRLLPGAQRGAARVLRQVGLAYDEEAVLRVLAPVREHIRRQYPVTPEDEDRALTLYLNRAAAQGNRVGKQGEAEASARLSSEVGNLRACVRRALDQGSYAHAVVALRGLNELARFSVYQGSVAELLAKAAQDVADPHDKAHCIMNLGVVALDRLNPEQARERFESALSLYTQVGSLIGQANCIRGLGDVALACSDYTEAQVRFESALSLYTQVGHKQGQANCISNLGDIALQRSDFSQARDYFDCALSLYTQIDSCLGRANCIRSLGDVALAGEDRNEAWEHFVQALTLYQQLQELYSIGWTKVRLARLSATGRERYAMAEGAFAAWRSIDREDLVQQLTAEFADNRRIPRADRRHDEVPCSALSEDGS